MSKLVDRVRTYKVANDVTNHVEQHKTLYSCIATGVAVAGVATITCLIMRGIASQSIGPSITGTASRGIIVTGKSTVMGNVSLISSSRQGAPSWVVRCIETGVIFTSQRSAAIAMDLIETNLSKHLNGMIDHVGGYHFERICLAA
jgi:hypothetical protein